MAKSYLSAWKTFSGQLGDNELVADDPKRLFSFILYEIIFPEDRSLFESRQCLALTAKSEEDLNSIEDLKKRELLWYLIQGCPEAYRITELCMRFIDFDPKLLNMHFEDYERAVAEEDYKVALECISKVICCEPNNGSYYGYRAEVLEKLGQDSSEDREKAQSLL